VMQYNRRRSTHWQFLLLGLWSLLAHLPGALGRRSLQRMYGQVLSNYQLVKPALPTDPEVLAGVGPTTAFKTRISIRRLPEDYLETVLPHANIPMYIAFGQYDIYAPHIEAVGRRYPGATFEILEGCGHLPWMDREDLFRTKLVSFYELLDRP
jgi:pimeloyl-ACP methyl ester carboxylesterase